MSRRHRTRSIPAVLTAVLLLALVCVPVTASAATVREYQLQYAPTGDAESALMIVSALLDPQVALPATVTIPVPKGATLLWAGEVLGGDPAADPAREVTKETIGDADVYTMTVEQSHTVQIEVGLPAPSISGSRLKASVAWVNPGDEVLVTGAVVAEAGASGVKTDPEVVGEVQTNSVGETLHALAGARVAPEGTYGIAVEWKRPAGASPAGSSPVLPIILGALVVAVLALVVVVTRERTRARRLHAAE